MKVLLISTNADEAGAPRHVESIVNAIGDKLEFVLVFGERGPVSQRLELDGYPVNVLTSLRSPINPLKDLVALIKIISLIRVHRPDVVHCHSAKAGMLGRIAAALNGIPWIYTVHGWGWRGVSRPTKAAVILIEWILSKLPFGYYVFVAEAVKNDGCNTLKLRGNSGSVIYNGVRRVEASLLPSASPFTILMPARVSTAKDHRSLVMAFEKLNDSNSRLVLCGTGTDSEAFVQFVKDIAPRTYRNIVFLGQRSDMEHVYSMAHVVALISHFEALPLSIIEAMSCGLPVIATNVGGVAELISDGTDGILVKPVCVEEITDAFIRCKDAQLRVDFGHRLIDKYRKKFTDESMSRAIYSLYHEKASPNS